MTIQHDPPPLMPQPEKWIGEHPFLTALITAALAVALNVVFRWAA